MPIRKFHPIWTSRFIKPLPHQILKIEDFNDEEAKLEETPIVEEVDKLSDSHKELEYLILNEPITRRIEELAEHCTASHQTATVEGILRVFKQRGWNNPGYHILIKPDGTWAYIHNLNLISNGVAGFNSRIINISYIGGIDRNLRPIDNRTPEQIATINVIRRAFRRRFPSAYIRGHRDFPNVKKACPCYDVASDLKLHNIK